MIVTTAAQRTGLVFGLLSVSSGQIKPLTDATFSAVDDAPKACRGVTLRVRSGTVKLCDKSDATDGFTLSAGASFGDDDASSLVGWWILEAAAGNATVEIICRTGGAS